MRKLGRRTFLKTGMTSAASLGAMRNNVLSAQEATGLPDAAPLPPPFKLGLVTYDLAKDWDIETIIRNCEETGFEGVELRTTHKHGVELSLNKPQRAEVKQRFAASRVRLMSLGTTCEYESPDAAVVEMITRVRPDITIQSSNSRTVGKGMVEGCEACGERSVVR